MIYTKCTRFSSPATTRRTTATSERKKILFVATNLIAVVDNQNSSKHGLVNDIQQNKFGETMSYVFENIVSHS